MWFWLIFGAVVSALTGLGVYLRMRWGRGALGGSFNKPENEIQHTTPWKGPPLW